MAGRAAPPPEREDVQQQVTTWRMQQLVDAGYPQRIAEAIARSNADLHLACDMLTRGCSPELAERILS